MPDQRKPAPDTFEALQEAQEGGRGLFGRMNAAFQDKLQNSRGEGRTRAPAEEAEGEPNVTADDLAIRRAKHVRAARMVVPEGVIIEGNMTSGSETEISGRVEGNVTVDGALYLGPSALVSGNVRATTCRVEGLVEGKVECDRDLELGETGRFNADSMAGGHFRVSGQVFGNITSGGLLHLAESCSVNGDIRAKRLVIEEGASFNGVCHMRKPAQRPQQTPAGETQRAGLTRNQE